MKVWGRDRRRDRRKDGRRGDAGREDVREG